LKQLKNWEESVDDEQSVSRASSLLSGFDYGFSSRSEGASRGLTGGLSNPMGYVTLLETALSCMFSSHMFCSYNVSCRTVFEEYGPPANIFALGIQQFRRNWQAIQGENNDEADVGT
jgi:hypothetical protein